jgi:hypothetical protein
VLPKYGEIAPMYPRSHGALNASRPMGAERSRPNRPGLRRFRVPDAAVQFRVHRNEGLSFACSAARSSADTGFTDAVRELAALLALSLPIGREGKYGLIAAASHEGGFPGELDRLSISSCANQGSAALRNYHLQVALREKEEQKRNLLSQKRSTRISCASRVQAGMWSFTPAIASIGGREIGGLLGPFTDGRLIQDVNT